MSTSITFYLCTAASWLKEATQRARSSNTPSILGFGKGCNFSLIKGLESSPEASWGTRKLKRCHERPALRDLKQQDGEGALRYLNVLCPFNKAGTLFSRSLFREWMWVRFVKKRILGKEKSHDSGHGGKAWWQMRTSTRLPQLLFLMRTPANNSGPKPVSRGNNSPRPLHQPPLQVPQLQALMTSLLRLSLPQLFPCSLWKFKLPQSTLCSYSAFRGLTDLEQMALLMHSLACKSVNQEAFPKVWSKTLLHQIYLKGFSHIYLFLFTYLVALGLSCSPGPSDSLQHVRSLAAVCGI